MFMLLRFRKKTNAARGDVAAESASDAPLSGEDARLRGKPQKHDPHAALHTDADTLLQRLEWTVLRRLDGLLQGDYRTLLRGFGLDFADLREYQPEDVTDLAPDVLRHRLVLSYEALTEAQTPDRLVQRILQVVPAPEKPLATHVQVAAA